MRRIAPITIREIKKNFSRFPKKEILRDLLEMVEYRIRETFHNPKYIIDLQENDTKHLNGFLNIGDFPRKWKFHVVTICGETPEPGDEDENCYYQIKKRMAGRYKQHDVYIGEALYFFDTSADMDVKKQRWIDSFELSTSVKYDFKPEIQTPLADTYIVCRNWKIPKGYSEILEMKTMCWIYKLNGHTIRIRYFDVERDITRTEFSKMIDVIVQKI